MSFDKNRASVMADPELNPSFRRRWQERPFSPWELDRLADFELSVGHHARAELLAHKAAEIRETSR